MFKKKPAYLKYSKRRMSLRKRRRIILIAVLAAVIIAALAGTYVLIRYENQPRTTYQEMEGISIPTVTCYYQNRLINRMYGYTRPMDAHYMRDTVYILQDKNTFDIHIEGADQPLLSVKYKVTDLPAGNLIQNSDATETLAEDQDAYRATLQIENMIEMDKEYSLELILTTQLGRDVHYYCRIIRASAPYLEDHLALIEKLHKGTFSYDAAEEAFSPFKSETDPLYDDTTSFERITMYSTISWLSWDEMAVKETIPATINIVDYDNELLFVRMDGQVGRELETSAPQYYNVSEFFRTRINETSTFLLDYERLAEQIFIPSGSLVSSDHINLGIVDEQNIHSLCSPDGNQAAFVVGKTLWLMNAKTKELTSVFNFISDNQDVRDIYDQHDIKIVSVTDEGDIRFLVYGYMNKGIHEGMAGIGLYTFRFSDLTVTEDAFIPSDVPYQLLNHSIGDLCYMNSSGNLYIMINGDVYSIDPETNAATLEVEGLSADSCKVSEDNRILAWQEDGKVNDADTIHVLNMETLNSYELHADEGKCIKVLGFLNNDLIYGQGDAGLIYTDANDTEYLLMSHMFASGAGGTRENETTQEDLYFISADQEYNRLILNRVTPTEDSYRTAESFTIFSTELNDYPNTTLYTATEETRGLVVLLGLPEENSASTPLNIIVSTSVLFSSAEVSDVAQMVADDWNYLVYAKGRLISPEASAATAVIKAYDNTGCVVNKDSSYFYRRGMRAAMADIPQDFVDQAIEAYQDELALNVTGIELAQAMSFISRRIPLIWERGDEVFVISGYTVSDALVLYNIETKEITYLGYNAAENVFTKSGRVFVYNPN